MTLEPAQKRERAARERLRAIRRARAAKDKAEAAGGPR